MKVFLRYMLTVLALGVFGSALAAPVPGKDYVPFSAPFATDSPGKIEVLEFFQYGCGHCYHFEPTMKAYKQKKAPDVEFKYVPTVWDDSRIPQAQLYYTIEAMGLLDQLHEKVYNAIHEKQVKLYSPDRALLMKWVAQQSGVDAKKFEETYDSPGVKAKVGRAKQLTKQFLIRGTPAVIVNGKYTMSPEMIHLPNGEPDYARFTQVLDELVGIERSTKKPAK